jgi:hypothetical protein
VYAQSVKQNDCEEKINAMHVFWYQNCFCFMYMYIRVQLQISFIN